MIEPSGKAKSTKNGYYFRGKAIEKYFSDLPVSNLTHNVYQSLLNEYGKSVTKDHVARVNSDVRTVIKFSQRSGLMLNDFTEDVKIYGQDSGAVEDKYLHSISDYKKLLVHLKEKFYYRESVMPYLLYLLFKTGFRVGEGMAVCWSDIDFNKKTIRTYRRYAGDRQEFAEAKTDTSIREIPIDADLLDVLSNSNLYFYKVETSN